MVSRAPVFATVNLASAKTTSAKYPPVMTMSEMAPRRRPIVVAPVRSARTDWGAVWRKIAKAVSAPMLSAKYQPATIKFKTVQKPRRIVAVATVHNVAMVSPVRHQPIVRAVCALTTGARPQPVSMACAMAMKPMSIVVVMSATAVRNVLEMPIAQTIKSAEKVNVRRNAVEMPIAQTIKPAVEVNVSSFV